MVVSHDVGAQVLADANVAHHDAQEKDAPWISLAFLTMNLEWNQTPSPSEAHGADRDDVVNWKHIGHLLLGIFHFGIHFGTFSERNVAPHLLDIARHRALAVVVKEYPRPVRNFIKYFSRWDMQTTRRWHKRLCGCNN